MHARRRHIHEQLTTGDRAADWVAAKFGSWRFIIGATAVIVVWITLNVVAWTHHWDPYPFILLNLGFSAQAFYAAPIILMSQNRSAAKDRLRDDTQAREVEQLVAMQSVLHILNERQMEVLLELRAIRDEERLGE